MKFIDDIEKIRRLGIIGIIIGAAFLLVGIAGLVLPIIPGALFIIIGLIILGVDIPFLRKIKKGDE